MQITIRKSVRKHLAEQIPGVTKKVLTWIGNKYPEVNFKNAAFIFSAGYNRSRYFRNELENAKYQAPNVCISARGTLILYDKRSLKMKRLNIYVGPIAQMESALVHELTHHVQYEQDHRKGNELDTTRNELEYLAENYPEHYSKLMN